MASKGFCSKSGLDLHVHFAAMTDPCLKILDQSKFQARSRRSRMVDGLWKSKFLSVSQLKRMRGIFLSITNVMFVCLAAAAQEYSLPSAEQGIDVVNMKRKGIWRWLLLSPVRCI